ncbi:MAG: single-stranded-DNA-specific exonuclease RecJ, partial [Patescibacteria group bacterium]|nr:single-stranded-DNA-specific exonuclease RecJ [Patescibacteria group bacterium]
GYGINKKAIKYIKNQKAKLVVSVDCGISNFEEIENANEEKLDIVILDHHHVPKDIPNAVAVVDPKKSGDEYPFKELAGVGVAFKFAQALVSKIDDFDDQRLKWLLDLVAIGTIADCVPLVGENRVLVKFGLMVLSKTKRVGLRQIFSVGRVSIDENNFPTSQQIAFQVAPRINAAGRMDHANTAFELLSCREGEEPEARVLALEIEDQNQHRQKVTKQIMDEVENKIGELSSDRKIIIESSPYWELGVVGLAAGKVTDKYNRPSILLKEKEDGILTGSCRSIPDFNMIEVLEKHNQVLEKYGGHSQAAGISIKKENFEEFKRVISKEAEKNISGEITKSIEVDTEIRPMEINEKIARELMLIEPFGMGNRQPVFYAKNLEVVDKKLVGKTGAHMKLWFKRKGGLVEAICFGLGERFSEIEIGKKIEAVFNIEEDSWNGNKKLQLRLIDF